MLRCLYFCTAMVFFLACSDKAPAPISKRTINSEEKNEDRISELPTLTIDGKQLYVEIAQDPETRAKGLMFRESLPENQGMLFIFPYEDILSFWMRNTYIPLDIAYMNADGIIVDIFEMTPLDESKNYVSSEPAMYAIEVNAGWFERNAIAEGAKVVF